MRCGRRALVVAVLGTCACGAEPSDAPSSGGSAGTSGSSSSAGAGGAGRAGESFGGGGSAGAAAGSSGADALACTPGFKAGGATLYPYPFDNCGEVEGLEGVEGSFRDLTLPNPVGPGETYAFSAEMEQGGGVYRIYGATAKCGPAGELLDSVEVERGDVVLCHQVSPVSGTYTHLIWVWNSSVEQGDTTFCEAGECPGR